MGEFYAIRTEAPVNSSLRKLKAALFTEHARDAGLSVLLDSIFNRPLKVDIHQRLRGHRQPHGSPVQQLDLHARWTTPPRRQDTFIFFFASNKTMIETLGIALLKRGPTGYPQPSPSPQHGNLLSVFNYLAGGSGGPPSGKF